MKIQEALDMLIGIAVNKDEVDSRSLDLAIETLQDFIDDYSRLVDSHEV